MMGRVADPDPQYGRPPGSRMRIRIQSVKEEEIKPTLEDLAEKPKVFRSLIQCCGASTSWAAPAPDKKCRLQAAPTPAPDTKICHFSSKKLICYILF